MILSYPESKETSSEGLRMMVENYTNAFLVSAFVLVFMVLLTIWAIWGLMVAGLVSWVADRLITVDFRKEGAG